jgi:xanthine dehydrogenase accessory factor
MDQSSFTGADTGPFEWPFFGLAEDIRQAAADEFARGRPVGLVTVVGVTGGAPRPLGSRMLANADGAPIGYVSGGCVEASAAEWAKEVIVSGKPQSYALGVGSPYVDIQLPCGGAIELYVERVTPDDPIAAPWLAGLKDRRERFWLANLQTGDRQVTEDIDAAAFLTKAEAARDAVRAGDVFVRRESPRLRFILVGADPVCLALAQLGAAMGGEVILIRDRGPSAGPLGLDAVYVGDEPGAALARIGVDRFTAVVSTTHDLDADEGALAAALAGGALYVGALGSRRRVPERLARLRERGLADSDLARIRSPVGLNIGAASPYEIAIATLADIVRVRRRGEAASDLA